MAWMPLPDQEFVWGNVSLLNDGSLLRVEGGWDQFNHGYSYREDTPLPDNIRLCRQVVDTPAQGVQIPADVAETIRLALVQRKIGILSEYETEPDRVHIVEKIIARYDRAFEWLFAQATATQE